MGPINIKGTRRQLKVLLDRVEAGETITISRRGAVIAKLVPLIYKKTPPLTEGSSPHDQT